ncbi:MAG: isochorismatase family protein [Desulfatiglandales bacterium]
MSNQESKKTPLIDSKDAVLLIVDMQDKLFKVMSEKEVLISNVLKLLKFSHIIDIPVVVTEQEQLGNTLYIIREDLLDTRPISKFSFDCFRVEEFKEMLNRINRKALIIIGIEAHICVMQTALHALSDYTVHVVGDAVSSRNPNNCHAALQRMAMQGVTITTTEMVMYELLKEAGTDTFKEVLKLVK